MSERSGVRTTGLIAGTVVGIAVVLLSVLVAGMRWKLPPVIDAVRRMNRSLTNPRVMRTAGSAGTQTSVIRHEGRTSGRTYETPVDVITTADGLIIAATAEVAGQLPARTLRTLSLFGVSECLHLQRSADGLG